MPRAPLPPDFFATADRDFLPHLSVDCVIFACHEGELKVLLLKWRHLDAWTLPGGYVRRGEPLDGAAARVLRERTGLDHVYLRQFHAFGGTERRENALLPVFRRVGSRVPRSHWIVSRVVSIGYFALVDFAHATPTADALSEEWRWWDVRERPTLIMDHDAIVERALETVRGQLDALPLANLLPRTFTMPELQRLYETVLGRRLDRRNFQKRILDLGIVERTAERRTGVAHRAPYLYRFVRATRGTRSARG